MIRVCHDRSTDPTMPDISPVVDELNALSTRFQMESEGFAQDLWLMLMTKGRALRSRKIVLADANRLRRKAKVTFGDSYKTVSKHYGFMRKLSRMAYFRKLCDVKDKLEAVERLLAIFRKLFAKQQKSMCSSCPKYGKCERGLGVLSSDEVDPNLPVADGCIAPSGDSIIAQLYMALAFLATVTDAIQGEALAAQLEREGSNDSAKLVRVMMNSGVPGKGAKVFDTQFTTGEHLLQAIDKMVDELTMKELAVFELARVFNEALLPSESEVKEDVQHISHDQKPREIQAIEEVQKALPSEFVSDTLMDKRITSGEMLVRQDMERHKRKNYFHILIDMSGSMLDLVTTNSRGMLTKGNMATALSLSILKRVSDEKGVLMLRFFSGAPDRLRRAEAVEDYAAIARLLGLSNYNGGSTRIQLAIDSSVKDIVEDTTNSLKKAEVLLITDGEDRLDVPTLKKALDDNQIKMHVLDVGPVGDINEALKAVAATYYKVNPNDLNLTEIARRAVGL